MKNGNERYKDENWPLCQLTLAESRKNNARKIHPCEMNGIGV